MDTLHVVEQPETVAETKRDIKKNNAALQKQAEKLGIDCKDLTIDEIIAELTIRKGQFRKDIKDATTFSVKDATLDLTKSQDLWLKDSGQIKVDNSKKLKKI
jgi:hypothetical protein